MGSVGFGVSAEGLTQDDLGFMLGFSLMYNLKKTKLGTIWVL